MTLIIVRIISFIGIVYSGWMSYKEVKNPNLPTANSCSLKPKFHVDQAVYFKEVPAFLKGKNCDDGALVLGIYKTNCKYEYTLETSGPRGSDCARLYIVPEEMLKETK